MGTHGTDLASKAQTLRRLEDWRYHMIFPSQQFRILGTFALTTLLCGASPQQERERRATPQPRVSLAVRSMDEQPRGNPMPTGSRGRLGGGAIDDGPMGSRRPTPMPGGSRVSMYAGTRVIVPPAWERCTALPTLQYWQGRDLMAQIQWLSRKGFLPVTPIGVGVDALSDYTQRLAGWRAYGLAVPAGGRVQFEVHHPKIAWFRLLLVNKWGQPGAGMMRAAFAPQPVMVTYTNPGKEATAVYIIVDDPAWWSDKDTPYTLTIRRDWDPLKVDLSQVPMVAGLWGASPSVSAEFSGPSLTGPAVYPY